MSRLTRRRALQAAGLGYLYTGPAWSVARAAGAADRLRVACVGVGGKGSSDTDQVAKVMDVAALCDIDADRLGKKAALFPTAKTFPDWRTLFDQMLKDVDAVTVSTPDHSHAGPAVRARCTRRVSASASDDSSTVCSSAAYTASAPKS